MNIFKNRYKSRIEAKIVELCIQRLKHITSEEVAKNTTDRVNFIFKRKECERDIKLLRNLLKP